MSMSGFEAFSTKNISHRGLKFLTRLNGKTATLFIVATALILTGASIYWIRKVHQSASFILGSYPSFAHTAAFTLYYYLCFGTDNKDRLILSAVSASILWLSIGIAFEVIQFSDRFSFYAGTFDFKDIIATTLGALFGACICIVVVSRMKKGNL